MSQARIQPLEPPYEQEISNLLSKMMPPNAPQEPLRLFRVLAHHPDLMSRMRPFAAGILGHGKIEARQRELVILRTCAQCNAEYEWGVHAAAFAQLVGLDEATITATIALSNTLALPVQDSLLLRMVDELHNNATISDDLWHTMTLYWSQSQLIELLLICGWYHTIAFICNATQVPLEEWALRFQHR